MKKLLSLIVHVIVAYLFKLYEEHFGMDEETRQHKLRLLNIYSDNLRELEVQAARHGMDTPLRIINEIKYHRENIDEIRVLLRTNAEEVTFDKLLVGIEDLRKFVKEEVKRVLTLYEHVHEGDYPLAQGIIALFSFGMLLVMGICYLYATYIAHINLHERLTDFGTIVLGIIGLIVNFIIAMKLASHVSRKQEKEVIKLVGYDPTKSVD